jgi:hypothetical protein
VQTEDGIGWFVLHEPATSIEEVVWPAVIRDKECGGRSKGCLQQ